MELKPDKRMKVNKAHWDLLLDFLELHPELINFENAAHDANHKIFLNNLWIELARKLNGLGMGTKTVEKWKGAVQDWKYKTKIKVIETTKNKIDPPNKKFSDQEQRLINLVGWRIIKDSEIETSETKPILEVLNTSNSSSENEEFDYVEPKIEPGLPVSPPPLIPLNGITLEELQSSENGDPLSDRIEGGRGVKRQWPRNEERGDNEAPSQLVQVLGTMSNTLTGILKELKVISGALEKNAERRTTE